LKASPKGLKGACETMTTIELLKYEVIFHWVAVSFYVISTVFFVYCLSFQKEESLRVGIWLALIGLVPHSAAIGVRWYAVGHGPYLHRMEGFSSLVWVALVMFLLLSFRAPRLRGIGFVVLPCCLLLMTLGLFSEPGIEDLPATFRSVWLIIHIACTKLAAGAILIALGTAIFYLLKKRKEDGAFYKRLPSLEALDDYSYQFAGFGFVFWAVMIASGALWAHESWGRYWGWDPIETWSLITWVLFGLYLHLRRFFGWRGKKAAWFMVVCFVFSILTLFVVPFVMKTAHSEYFL
jgi:cytochrome c-type biogenesis protein CcsB